MTKAELDYILATMLDSHKDVSDLNFTVEKPPQVESYGELNSVRIDPPIEHFCCLRPICLRHADRL